MKSKLFFIIPFFLTACSTNSVTNSNQDFVDERVCSKDSQSENCIRITGSLEKGFRLVIDYDYFIPQNNPTLNQQVKKTSWSLSIKCTNDDMVDFYTYPTSVYFYDTNNQVIKLSDDIMERVAQGLYDNAAPKMAKQICEG